MDLVFSTFNVHLNQMDLDLLYAIFLLYFALGTVTVINSWDHDEDYTPMVKLDKITLPFSNRRDSFRRRRFMACLPYNAAAVWIGDVVPCERAEGERVESFRARYRPTLALRITSLTAVWKRCAKNTPYRNWACVCLCLVSHTRCTMWLKISQRSKARERKGRV